MAINGKIRSTSQKASSNICYHSNLLVTPPNLVFHRYVLLSHYPKLSNENLLQITGVLPHFGGILQSNLIAC